MADSLEAQVNIAQRLLSSLNGIVDNARTSRNTFESQTEIAQGLNQTLNTFSNSFGTMTTNFLDMSKKMSSAFDGSVLPGQVNFSKEMEKGVDRARSNAEEATGATQKIAESTDERSGLRNKQAKAATAREAHAKAYIETSKRFIVLDAVFGKLQEKLDKATEAFYDLDIVKRAAMSGGWSLLLDIPKLIITGVFKVLSSIVGLYFNFFKTAISLPFMVAERAVQIGNAFREDIIVNIGNAYQATKEYSDANSNIGKGIKKMQNVAVGALKTFENPRSYMVQLFGEGAAGAAAFLSEIGKAIDDMGPVAEIIGPQVSNSAESAEFLLTAMRGLGLTSKEVSYYALDSAVTQQNIFDRLENVKKTVTLAADNHSVDTKQVSLGMQKLRSNIKDFGHLSDMNLANLVARMRQLNVGAEDLVNVFSKFTSFEDSAKTAAMLQQSFNMSIDALDMLTAKDPGEIVEKFRDAMFQTGRDYEDLNRHEKQLMQTTTGMSDAMLKSLMTYQNMGLSYAEAKQRIADNDPTKQQIESIKGLTSSVKEIQKIMTFTSPFQAFMKGLGKNAAASDKVIKVSKSLSSLYETIYLFGLNLDKATIQAITKPVIMIVNKVNDVFKSTTFKNLLTTGTKTMSSIVSFVTKDFGVSNKDYSTMSKIIDKMEALSKSKNLYASKDRKSIRSETQKLISTADKSVLKYLKTKGVITEDKKIVKKMATQAVLNEIKLATLHVESDKGKQNLSDISNSLNEYTTRITSKYIFDKEFTDSVGIRGQIEKTTKSFKAMFEQGGGLFMTIFKLGGKIMGAIIKGFALAFSALMMLMVGKIDDAYSSSSRLVGKALKKATGQSPAPGQPFDLLAWLGITKKEKGELSDGVVKGLRDLVMRTPKLFSITGVLLKSMISVSKQIVDFVLGIVSSAMLTISKSSIKGGLFYSLYFTEKEKREIQARATGGTITTDLGKIRSNISRNDKKRAKKGQVAIDGYYFKQLYDKYKAQYSMLGDDKDPYAAMFTREYGTSIDHKQFNEIMKSIARVHYLENQLSYPDYITFMKSHTGENKKNAVSASLLRQANKQNLPSVLNDTITRTETDYADGPGGVGGIPIQHEIAVNLTGGENDLSESEAKSVNSQMKKALKAVENMRASKPKYNAKNIGSHYSTLVVKDGVANNATSIFKDGALKLITASGRVITPDNMDELASLSGKTQSKLIEVFSSAANVYQSASNLVSNYSTINSSDATEEASEELIGEMIGLFYETLEISTQIKKNDYTRLEVNV